MSFEPRSQYELGDAPRRRLMLRIYYRRRGDHVHTRVFSGLTAQTLSNCGDLVFGAEEWPAVVALLGVRGVEFLLEDGG